MTFHMGREGKLLDSTRLICDCCCLAFFLLPCFSLFMSCFALRCCSLRLLFALRASLVYHKVLQRVALSYILERK